MIWAPLAMIPAGALIIGAASDVPPWIDSISRVGVVGVLVLALFGLYRKWWVPGWAHADLQDRHDKLQARYDIAIDIALQSSRGVAKTASLMDEALARGRSQ